MRRLKPVFVLILMTLLLADCKRQRHSAAGSASSGRLLSVLNVADDNAAVQLVHGFYDPEGNAWRWTGPRFSVVLAPPPAAKSRGALLVLKVTVPQNSLNSIGPITLSARLPGLELTPKTFSQPGDVSYSRDIPASVLASDAVNIDFHLDKTLPPSGADSRRLGLVVSSIALEPR